MDEPEKATDESFVCPVCEARRLRQREAQKRYRASKTAAEMAAIEERLKSRE